MLANIVNSFFDEKKFITKNELCYTMCYFGSDKGRTHNYTTFYYHIFDKTKLSIKNVFEVGLGTNNPNIPSSMGLGGIPLASLRGWRSYFVNAMIYGADVDKDIIKQEDRIKTFYCDQTKSEEIFNLWNNIQDKMDIIIDDGLHNFDANKTFYKNSINKVVDNGFYIIEDVNKDKKNLEKYNDMLSLDVNNKLIKDFQIVEIPFPDRDLSDNVLVVIQK